MMQSPEFIGHKIRRKMSYLKTIFGHVRLFLTKSFYLGKQYDLPEGWDIYIKVRKAALATICLI